DLEYFRTHRTNGTSAEVVARLEIWQELARESLASMRETLGGLRGSTVLDFGIEAALQKLVTDLRDEGYEVIYEASEWPFLLPFEYTSNLYSILCEALTNI